MNHKLKGELGKAEEMIRKSLEISDILSQHHCGSLAGTYLQLGQIYKESGDKEKERESLQKSLEIFKIIRATSFTGGNRKLIEKIQKRIDEL